MTTRGCLYYVGVATVVFVVCFFIFVIWYILKGGTLEIQADI